MPVYKEGLIGVIRPTVISLKAAISTYELQGGTANIFVNDDGMQLIPEDEAQAHRDFYDENNIGWVSRPKHNPKPEDGEKVFLRRGKFKKASNMNYALMISNKVEEKLLLVERTQDWTQEEEYPMYDECLAQVLSEEEGRAWSEGNIRVGDDILLIDSDTRVPLSTVCLMLQARWSNRLNAQSCSTPRVSCRLPTAFLRAGSLSLPILFIRLSTIPSPMAMYHLSWVTMRFCDSQLCRKSVLRMRMDMRSFGRSRMSQRTSTCPCGYSA